MADASTPARRPWHQHPHPWIAAWIVWFAALWILSSIPGNSLPNPFDVSDKIQHAGYFFGGGCLVGGWMVAAGHWPRRRWWIVAAAALVGALDETHQWFTPGRSGLDVGDWIADVVGGLAALGATHFWARRTGRTGRN